MGLMGLMLDATEFALGDGSGFGGDEVSEGVGGVIAADAFFVGIDF
jgi:hypothetical protein